ncbi:Methyl-accepting chemotaxis protein [Collimonas arenae]|uniref:Methyl-accepting chemotaxis protein n=1 Tax=Collimonas arenae TaxID=279058 RepID=A0A0A1FE96_9BURK|nr:Methyl-accepting chemotaxis protein [Collimonas arenae]
MARIHVSLQNPARLRIEGERVGLPGPALTPYLVGLLVMLGMLGTFLGMVVTLNGAVFALEKTIDLQAIRSALAVPVRGLGLAFGTSVAGVAASAMLGLMSALSRRERMQAAQLLDTRISTVLRRFSLAHQRQETFKALQLQSQALPEVVDKLQAMMTQMEERNQQLNQRLISNQEGFHGEVKVVYTDLANAVDTSLRASLSQSAQAAGESIKPVFEAAMSGIAAEAKAMHERMADNVQVQLDGLTTRFGTTVTTVADTWKAALASHEQANAGISLNIGRSLEAFKETFEQRSGALIVTVGEAYTGLQIAQAGQDRQRQQAWTQSLETMAATLTRELQQTGSQTLAQQQEICSALTQTAQEINKTATTVSDTWTAALASHEQESAGIVADMGRSLKAFTDTFEQRSGAFVSAVGDAYTGLQTGQAEQDKQRQQAWTQSLEAVAATLTRELQQTSLQTLTQQREICSTLTQTTQEIIKQSQTNAANTLTETTRLITSAEELIRSRIASEAQWIEQHCERMDRLASMLRTELGALKDEEALRGNAAVERLGQLQTALTSHLTTLGTALEAPITRLIETASEAPRAAAEVIGQLRREISNSVVRDNELLEERSRIMATLNTLLNAINQTSLEQRSMIGSLVDSSAAALNAASSAISENVAAETTKLSDIAAHVTSSAVEVSSLSEAFGFAVHSFNEANEKLIGNLQRIEEAMDKSALRSNEQLAYYVSQAREIIDLSMMSQKEIFEALRQFPAKQTILAEGVL